MVSKEEQMKNMTWKELGYDSLEHQKIEWVHSTIQEEIDILRLEELEYKVARLKKCLEYIEDIREFFITRK